MRTTTLPGTVDQTAVNVHLAIPATIGKTARELRGSIVLSTVTERVVDEINIKLVKSYRLNRGGFEHEEEVHLGEVHLSPQLKLAAGETRAIPFNLSFEKSMAQVYPYGTGPGQQADLHSRFFVEADVDLNGEASDPSVKKDITLE
jgi:sporulation-control protein spo0M